MGLHSALASGKGSDIDEAEEHHMSFWSNENAYKGYTPSVVDNPLLGTALWRLLFLLLFDLGGLRLDFASTR